MPSRNFGVLGILFILMSSILYALATKSVPLWLYITLSIAAGITLAILIMSRDQKHASIYVSMIALALILWNFHAIATNS
jgi:hypothetical protein